MAEASVSKENLESLAEGSEVTFDIVCYPCNSAGETKEAEGYCTDCREHMCTMCLKCHTRMSLTKHHTLVYKDNMPGTQGHSVLSDVCTQPCQIHKNEVIKYYCPSHKALGCGVCMVSTHDICKGKLHIPDEAKHLDGSKEFNDFQTMLVNLIKKSDMIINSSNHNIRYASACLDKVLHKIETFRQEINDILDKLKVSLEEQAGEKAMQDKTMMAEVLHETSKVQTDLKQMLKEVDTLLNKKQHCQLFMEMKNSERKLADFLHQLENSENSRITGFKFKPCEDLQKLLRRKDALGELIMMNQTDLSVTHVADINVKTRDNEKTCKIYGLITLSKGKVVIADIDNESVKLIDTECRQILSEYKPEKPPYDVASVSSTEVVVTVPEAGTILFFRAEDTLSLIREAFVNNNCCFIACIEDKLVISFKASPLSIGILSMAGDLLQKFSTSVSGEPLFSEVPCVTTSPFSKVIYASDWKNNKLTMLDMEGNVLAEYSDGDLKSPGRSAVDDLGMVFLVGINSHNIHLLTPACRKVKVLLTKKNGIKWPLGLSYCRDTHRLFVTSEKKDSIKVYQLLNCN